MNQKQLIILLVSIVMSMSLVLLLAAGMYKYKPELLGLPSRDTVPEVAVWDTLQLRRETVIDPMELNRLRKSLQEYKAKFRSEKMKAELAYKLDDTLTDKEMLIRELNDTVDVRETKIEKLLGDIEQLKDSIADLDRLVDMHKSESDLYSEMIDEQSAKFSDVEDSLYVENFKSFAKLYNNAEPADVAQILSRIDDADAARILKFMQKKKAGAVIENLPANKAAAILLLGY